MYHKTEIKLGVVRRGERLKDAEQPGQKSDACRQPGTAASRCCSELAVGQEEFFHRRFSLQETGGFIK